MSMTTTTPRQRYQPTPEECRRGGQAAAAKLTREQRRAGGLCRSRQPSFRDLQRRRGRKGAAVVLARYGPRALVEILAAYYRGHPTSLERFVHGVLRSFGVPFETQRVVEVTPGQIYWRLDVVLPGRPEVGTRSAERGISRPAKPRRNPDPELVRGAGEPRCRPILGPGRFPRRRLLPSRSAGVPPPGRRRQAGGLTARPPAVRSGGW